MKSKSEGSHKLLSKIGESLLRSSPNDQITGEVLKRKGIITDEQLQTALIVQRDKLSELGQAVHLGLIIVDLGFASEDQVVEAINANYQLSINSLADDFQQQLKERRGSFRERLPRSRIPMWLQLAAATTLIIAFTIFVLSYLILDRQKDQLYQQTVKIGLVSLNHFDSNSKIALLEDDILALNTLIRKAESVEGLSYAIIVGADGTVKAHTDHRQIGRPFEPIEPADTVNETGQATAFTYRLPDGGNILNLTRPVKFKNQTVGTIHVGVSIDFIEEITRKERQSLVIITTGIILVGVLTAILLGIRFSRPISKLVLATEAIGRGDYHFDLNLKRNDELGTLAAAFKQMSRELWKKSLMQKSFGKYVGSEVLEMIMANPANTWLKGRKNEATIFFADIRGFTSYSDRTEPEKIVEALNDYFEVATKAIVHQGGYLDKFVGDAVMGVFGVPVYRKNHSERAVKAALVLQRELKKASRDGNQLLGNIGIGIASGGVISGNIGSQAKMEYTVIGDCVNVASRLGGLAGPGEIMITRKVLDQLKGLVAVEALPPREIKGKPQPVEIYRVLNIKERPFGRTGTDE